MFLWWEDALILDWAPNGGLEVGSCQDPRICCLSWGDKLWPGLGAAVALVC